MKVSIIIIVYNLPSEVTILQVNAIRKFCKDDHEIFIIDNSTDKGFAEATRYHVGQLGVHYMKTNASSKNGSDSHSFAANFSFQRLQNSAPILFYLDHDCIPIRDFSCSEMLEHKLMAGLGQQGKKTYFWQGCCMLKVSEMDKELVDFRPNAEFKLDTGGNLYKLIEKYGEDNCVFFNEAYHQNPYYNGKYNSYAVINDSMFAHFIAASGWNEGGSNLERINSLINVVKELIGD